MNIAKQIAVRGHRAAGCVFSLNRESANVELGIGRNCYQYFGKVFAISAAFSDGCECAKNRRDIGGWAVPFQAALNVPGVKGHWTAEAALPDGKSTFLVCECPKKGRDIRRRRLSISQRLSSSVAPIQRYYAR